MKKISIELAKQILEKYYPRVKEKDIPIYTEILEYLISETNDPDFYNELGGFYYGKENYKLAMKYFELSAEQGDYFALLALGRIWFEGIAEKVDYEKAYHYFELAMDAGSIDACNMVADMYKYGFYFDKNYDKYCEIIEETYDRTLTDYTDEITYPETSIRMAEIYMERKDNKKAYDLLMTSKQALICRIKDDRWIGDAYLMKRLIDNLYQIKQFDRNEFDIFDLFHVFKDNNEVIFCYKDKTYRIIHDKNDSYDAYLFDDDYFYSLEDLIFNGMIGIYSLGILCEDLHSWRII